MSGFGRLCALICAYVSPGLGVKAALAEFVNPDSSNPGFKLAISAFQDLASSS